MNESANSQTLNDGILLSTYRFPILRNRLLEDSQYGLVCHAAVPSIGPVKPAQV